MGKAGQQYILNTESKKQDVTEPCRSDNHCTPISSAYRYLTGGNPMPLYKINENGVLYVGGDTNADTPNFLYGNNPPMTSSTFGGDSGSPLFAYNKNTKQWELIAVLQGREWNEAYVSATNVLIKNEFNQNRMDEDKIVVNNAVAEKQYDWQITTDNVKNSILTDVGTVGLYAGKNYKANQKGVQGLDENLNHGKTLHFKGEKGVLNLKSTLNQGAGALYFDNDFTVKADNDDITWLGAGVSVAEGKTVNWQVKNPENDRLSKVGKGTLHVNGTGTNEGDISVGDGLVILDQKDGKAFNQVGIVSGRGMVRLADDKRVNPNDIYFGYRGGRLDVNGNNLTFNYIQNVDDGAMLVNHNQNAPTNVMVIGKKNDIVFDGGYASFYGKAYRVRGENRASYKPADGQDNLDFALFANDANDDDDAFFSGYRQKMQELNVISAFNGFLGEKDPAKPNGVLNFIYNPKGLEGIDHTYLNTPPTSSLDPSKYTLLLSGGSNLNGNLVAQAGTLLLSGRPTPYAIDAINRKELFKDDDWIDRTFKVNNLVGEKNSKVYVGRNVENLIGHITFKDNSVGEIGFINGQTPVCIRSDHHGETECQTMSYLDNVLQTIPTTNVIGNLTLNNDAKVTLGKAHLIGKSNADDNTKLTLSNQAKWTMTDSSKLGHLNMENGSEITLNANFTKGISDKFNLLTVAGNLTGRGKFNYLTKLSDVAGDKVLVKGNITDVVSLNVTNQGTEPAKSKEHLTLLTANGNVNQAPVLANKGQVVDLGAYRYALKSDDGKVYYLWSEGLDNKPADPKPAPTDYGKKPQSQYTSKYTNLALSAQHADIRAVVRATTLAGRVLDVRPKHTGVWLHTNHSEFDRSSDYYRAYSDEQNLVQFGVDDDFNVGKGVLIFGTALSHAKGNQTFDEGTGKSRLTMAHLYGKWSFKDVFLGMDAGYGQVNQTIELGGSSRYRQNFANVGMMAGKTWQFSNSFIEPSLGIRHYQAFDSNAYTIDGANVRLLNFTATAYQPSLKFGYVYKSPTGLTFSPYVSTTYGHWTGDTKLAVNGYQFSVPLVNEWQHKLGFDLQKGKFSGQLYTTYDKDKESGDGYSLGLNVGYRW